MKFYKKYLIFLIMIFSFFNLSFAGPYEDGVRAVNKGDYDTAFPLLCFATSTGDKKALILHSRILSTEGLERDYRMAKQCWIKALNEGRIQVRSATRSSAGRLDWVLQPSAPPPGAEDEDHKPSTLNV